MTFKKSLCWLRSHLLGEISKTCLVWVCGPLAVLFFAGGMILSGWFFPDSYDWRYQVMCSLGSRAKNPDGHIYWSIALLLTIFMGWPTCLYYWRRLSHSAPGVSLFSGVALGIGYLAGIVVAVETAILPEFGGMVYKAHEIVAVIAFSGIYLGVAGYWYCLTIWLLKEKCWSVWAVGGLFFLSAAPMSGAMLSQAWLFFSPDRPGWVSREWISLGIPMWLSFAFWEWLAACGLVVCLYVLAVVLPADPAKSEDPHHVSGFDIAVGEQAKPDNQKGRCQA